LKNVILRRSFTYPASLIAVPTVVAVARAAEDLPRPQSITLTAGQEWSAQPIILAARRYAAFWNSGEAHYAEAALSVNFIDRTLPPERPQGFKGVLQAAQNFRAAIPDLRAEIEELVVMDHRAIVRHVLTGHFTGKFKELKGDGRAVSARAVNIYRVQNGLISDNWHHEEHPSLMQQLGAPSF
jgi:predicted ester cyclase